MSELQRRSGGDEERGVVGDVVVVVVVVVVGGDGETGEEGWSGARGDEGLARGDDDEKRGERAPRPTGGGDDAVRGFGRGSADARDAKEKGGDEGGDEGADVAGEDETGETERLEVSRRRHGAEEDDGHVPDAKAENGEDVGDGEGGDDGVAGRRMRHDDEESTQTERGVDDAADDEDGPRRGGG